MTGTLQTIYGVRDGSSDRRHVDHGPMARDAERSGATASTTAFNATIVPGPNAVTAAGVNATGHPNGVRIAVAPVAMEVERSQAGMCLQGTRAHRGRYRLADLGKSDHLVAAGDHAYRRRAVHNVDADRRDVITAATCPSSGRPTRTTAPWRPGTPDFRSGSSDILATASILTIVSTNSPMK